MYMQQHILKHRWWALVVMVLVCMTGCSNVETDWKKAESENTIPAYEEFLKRHPEGSLADKTRLRIEELYNERKPAFRHTRTVKIMVEQSYGEAEGVSLPFEDIARRLCRYAGLEVVGVDAEDYDVTLKIQAKGSAVRAMYIPIGYQYSGASLSGSISLEIPRIPAYKKSFKGYSSPPREVKNRYANPSSAPFDKAFRKPGSFVTGILEIMGEVYGINLLIVAMKEENFWGRENILKALGKIGKPAVEPLIAALHDANSTVRVEAAWALGEIKDRRAVEPLIAALNDEDVVVRASAARALGEIKDSRAVEPLIAPLNDVHPWVREAAVGALKRITKQDFWQDYDTWLKWWQENKKKYQPQ